MKSVYSLFYYFVLSLIIFDIGEGTVHYDSLIKDVYKTYMAKSIIIAPSKNYLSLERISIFHKISKELSASGISSVVMNPMQLREGIRFHNSKSPRFLIVTSIDKVTELHEFSKEIENTDLRSPLLLVLFTGNSDRDHCRYCRDPIGNLFNLKFNSEMLVLCCDSEYIEEWWSQSENETSKLPRGKWIEGVNEIKWYPNGTLYNHRQSINKRAFRIAIVKGSLAVRKKNDQLFGYMAEPLTELSRLMNFTISDVIEEENHGTWDPKSSIWMGAIGTITNNKADIGASDFIITPERMNLVDFTVPIRSSMQYLYFKKSSHVDIIWNAWLKPFHRKIWMTIGFFLLITPLLLTIIKYQRKYNFFDMFFEHYLNVWGIFCQNPLPDSPEGSSVRIIYISTYIMALVLYAAYSAEFITSLTITSLHLPFANLQEFVDDGTYELIVVKKHYDVEYTMFEKCNDTVPRKMLTMMKPKDAMPISWEEALKQICTEKVALFAIEHGSTEYHTPCEIGSIAFGPAYHAGMILPLNSEYTGIVKYHLQQLKYNGMLSRSSNKYFRKIYTAHSIHYKSVTFEEVVPILITLAAGFSIAFIIFGIEIP